MISTQEGNDTLNFFRTLPSSILDGVDRWVYIILRFRRNHKTGVCYLKRETLALEAGCSVTRVKKAIARLISIGAIEKEEKFRKTGGNSANQYRVQPYFWERSEASNDQFSSAVPNEVTPFEVEGGGRHTPPTGVATRPPSKNLSLYCLYSSNTKIFLNLTPEIYLFDCSLLRSTVRSEENFSFDAKKFVVPRIANYNSVEAAQFEPASTQTIEAEVVQDTQVQSILCDNDGSFFGGKRQKENVVKSSDGAYLASLQHSNTAKNTGKDLSPRSAAPPLQVQRECPGSPLKNSEPMNTPDSHLTPLEFEICPQSGDVESITLTGKVELTAKVNFRTTPDPMSRYSAGGNWSTRKDLHDRAIDIYNKTKPETWLPVRFPDRRLYESLDRLYLKAFDDLKSGLGRFSNVEEIYLRYLSAAILSITSDKWYCHQMNSTLRTLQWLSGKPDKVWDLAIAFLDMSQEQQSHLQGQAIDRLDKPTRTYIHPYTGDPIIRLAAKEWLKTLLEIPADDRSLSEVDWLNTYYEDLAEQLTLPGS